LLRRSRFGSNLWLCQRILQISLERFAVQSLTVDVPLSAVCHSDDVIAVLNVIAMLDVIEL
jgi:hypothetical protein